MDRHSARSSPSPSLLIGLAAMVGTGALGWRTLALEGRVAEESEARIALLTRLEAERSERSLLEADSRDLARRADALAVALTEARRAMAESGSGVAERMRALEQDVEAVAEALPESARRLEALEDRSAEDADELAALRGRVDALAPGSYEDLLGPTVKLSTRSDVGSGTVIFSGKRGEKFVAYAVTAFHIVEQNCDAKAPIPLEVISFEDGLKVREERGIVVLTNPALDLALVEIESDRPYESIAKLVSPDRVAAIPLYARVHAIGCPLGYAPMPTSGELTSKCKTLDGQTYWMINAPTIFGNSGGGIFLAETGELIGVLSRIAAYKNGIDVAVPHMGIITSMDKVYDWLDREQYGFVFGRGAPVEALARSTAEESKAAAPPAPEDRSGLVPAGSGSGTSRAD